MNEVEAIEIGREAILTMLKVAAPIMIMALIVGLAIALFQALTSIQEMTLTFVPKIVAILVVLAVASPFMYQSMNTSIGGLPAKPPNRTPVRSIPQS